MTGRPWDRQLEAALGYEDKLVPALMNEWAPRVADAAGIHRGDQVPPPRC